MAHEFEARNLLLVLGEYIWQKEVIPPLEQWATAVRHVRTLGEHAAALGLEIALELEPFQLSLLNDVPSMVRFLADVDHPAVKANLDISHLALAHQPPSAVEALRGRVAHVHISDCDGKVHGDLPPGRGVVDFPPYLEAIKRLGIDDATISVELEYSPDPEHIVEWVAEAHDKTAALDARPDCDHEQDVAPARHAGAPWVAAGPGGLAACRDGPGGVPGAAAAGPGYSLSLGLDDWALRIRRVWSIEPEPASGSVLDPAATARSLRDTGGLARPARLAVETLALVVMTEALVLPPGILLALLLFRTDIWGRGLLLGILGIAAFVPLPLHATAWLGALGNAGRMQAIGLRPVLVGRTGAAIIHALACLPWVVFLVGVGLRTIEPELEESAELDMPAGRVWSKVTLRRAVGAIAAAAVAVAVLTAGDMTVTDLLQVRTYAEEAYVQFTLGRGPADAALVSVPPLIILGGSIVLVARSLAARGSCPPGLGLCSGPAVEARTLACCGGRIAAPPGRQPGGVAALQPGLARRPGGGAGPARSTADLVARGPAGNARLRRRRELGADPRPA